MLTPELLRRSFDGGVGYGAYVETGNADQSSGWKNFHQKVLLTAGQRAVVGAFTRKLHVLAISGVWCGDCVQQMPMLDHIAGANPGVLHLRFVDRDEHKSLAEQVKICGGLRVPTVLFLNEDFEFSLSMGTRVWRG